MTVQLNDRARAILDFEGGPHWVYAGAKEDEIRRRFNCSATSYYQQLNALLDDPAALTYAPAVVNRLRRLRDARRRTRRVG